MKKQTDDRALQAYIDHLNGLLNSTVTDSRLRFIQGTNPTYRVIARLYNRDIVPLELKPRGFLYFRQLIQIKGRRVIVEEFTYQYWAQGNAEEESQYIFRYEYSRSGFDEGPNKPHAHLHVNGTHTTSGKDLSVLHFPTGRLSLEQILAHLITEHEIRTKTSQEDAIEVLRVSHAGFVQRRLDLKDAIFP